jgi:flagellar hook-associated protein 2
MGISIGGIVSGLDTESLISGLVQAAEIPKTLMEDQLGDLEDLDDAYAGLISRLEDLQEAMEDMDGPAALAETTATSSDDSSVSVHTDGDAVRGSYSVTVTALATAGTSISDGVADKSSTGVLATGTFLITVAGTTTSINLDATNSSLEDLASAIDDIDGVSAYIMNTGDATSPYRLVIVGDEAGADNAISVDTSGMDATTGIVPGFTEMVAAADAQLTVNGIAITHGDNEVDGVVEGVTFSLRDVTTESVTVTVATDTTTMVGKFETFVEKYNALVSYIDSKSVYDAEKELKGPFVGESTVSTTMRWLQSVLTDSYAAGSTITALSHAGFSTTQQGELELDTDALAEALDNYPDDLYALFDSSDIESFATALTNTLDLLLDDEEGSLELRRDTLEDSISRMQDDIDDFDARMEAYEARLRAQFTAMELALAEIEDATSQLSALMTSTTSDS